MNRPPNIISIHSHDRGRIIEPYGYPLPTPDLMPTGAGIGDVRRDVLCEPDVLAEQGRNPHRPERSRRPSVRSSTPWTGIRLGTDQNPIDKEPLHLAQAFDPEHLSSERLG